MKIKKGDTILVIKGKYRSKTGKVLRVFPNEEKVVAEGINLTKKHVKPKKSGEKGQIVEMSLPMNVSKIKLICPNCGKPAKVARRLSENKKYRVCKNCGKEI